MVGGLKKVLAIIFGEQNRVSGTHTVIYHSLADKKISRVVTAREIADIGFH